MASRRLTVFPRSESLSDQVNVRQEKASRDLKRKFNSTGGPIELKLPRILTAKNNTHKIFIPTEQNPSQIYRCIHLVDPEGERPYCVAQETAAEANEYPYRIVMIRRTANREVTGLANSSPNLLNVIKVFQFEGSTFTVLDRPGFLLSEIVVSHSPQLGAAEIKTIGKEVSFWELSRTRLTCCNPGASCNLCPQ
jgi:hypothetical protein